MKQLTISYSRDIPANALHGSGFTHSSSSITSTLNNPNKTPKTPTQTHKHNKKQKYVFFQEQSDILPQESTKTKEQTCNVAVISYFGSDLIYKILNKCLFESQQITILSMNQS